MKDFSSHGKLLLTGEYVVLDGALALALPTKFGQTLKVSPLDKPQIDWKSLSDNGTVWFEASFTYTELNNKAIPEDPIKAKVLQILRTCKSLNADFLVGSEGFKIITTLQFPRAWGLGSSSTLINNMAQWAQVDAYALLAQTFGGSGYDIACANASGPLTYQLKNEDRLVNQVIFNPSFKSHLYFVYLNQKQNSRSGIKHYHKNKAHLDSSILLINNITQEIINCQNLHQFNNLITQHEQCIAKVTNQIPVKDGIFKDFHGAIKSLGAWGGDFILVGCKTDPTAYFKNKGFPVVIKYTDMIL